MASSKIAKQFIVVHALVYTNIFGIKWRKRHHKLKTKDPRAAAIIADAWVVHGKLSKREQVTVWID